MNVSFRTHIPNEGFPHYWKREVEMKRYTTLKTSLAAIAWSLLLAGCFSIFGGGWIWSAGGPEAGKATFGFELYCDQDTDEAWGHITYHDHGVNVDVFEFQGANWKGRPNHVAIQGDVFAGLGYNGYEGFGCNDDALAFFANYIGTYTPVPESVGDGGFFQVAAYDGGEPGPDKDDWLEITILSGVFEGYFNTGELQGGNIYLPE